MMSHSLNRLALVLFFLGVNACSSLPEEHRPLEHLDERTGATLLMVRQPLVFARDRSERAANLRDYVTFAGAAVDRAGSISYVIVTYSWSTLDVRDTGVTSTDTLFITADDRRLELKPAAGSAVDAGLASLLSAPWGMAAVAGVYATDLDTLRFLSASRVLRLQVKLDADASYYDLWEDRRAALRDFVRVAEEGVR